MDRQSFAPQSSLVLSGIKAEGRDGGGRAFEVSAEKVVVTDIFTLWDAQRKTHLSASGIEFEGFDVKATQAALEGDYQASGEQWRFAGPVTIERIYANGQAIKKIACRLEADQKAFKLTDLNMQLGTGRVSGEFMLEFGAKFPYYMDIALENIPTKQLNLQDHLDGILNGRLKVRGDQHSFSEIEGKLKAPAGVMMNARLLSPLLSYIPQSTQKKQIESIIAQNKTIFVDVFALELHSRKANFLKTQFDIESKEYNLDVNLGVDINTDGGIQALLNSDIFSHL
jgi:hypothetical protein